MTEPETPPPHSNDIREHVVFRMSLLTTIAERSGKIYFQSRFGLTLREYRILGVIGYTQPVSVIALATECFLDKGQVSRVVATLVDQGLVTRGTDDAARGGTLALTQAGKALLTEALAYGDELNAISLSVLTSEELAAFSNSLDKLIAHAKVNYAAVKNNPALLSPRKIDP